MQTPRAGEQQRPDLIDAREHGVSRRQFLKTVAIGLGAAGLAGLTAPWSGCKSAGEISSTSAPTTTTGTSAVSVSTTTTSQTTTTSVAGPKTRNIRVGLIAPLTGDLGQFAAVTGYLEAKWTKALASGVLCGDGKRHQVAVSVVDTQSKPELAASMANFLITEAEVDVVLVASGSETAVPAARICEVAGVPLMASFLWWQPFFFGRQKTPDPMARFKWTYAHAVGIEQTAGSFMDMWNQIATNRTAGFLVADDADGAAWEDENMGMAPPMTHAGYKVVDPGLVPVPEEDFAPLIDQYQTEGCEILTGSMAFSDFSGFWQQAGQAGFRPKVVTMGKGLLFPETLATLATGAEGMTTEYFWGPAWPFKSSLTGETCQELADDYEAATGTQWTAAIGSYGLMEWLVDALKRTEDVSNREQLVAAIASAKLETVLGPLDFTAPARMGTLRPVENVYLQPVGGGQWVKGSDHPLQLVQVSNVWSEQCPIQAKVKEMAYPG
jgi:branched-chain amino acid transport system substrate-binding protein